MKLATLVFCHVWTSIKWTRTDSIAFNQRRRVRMYQCTPGTKDTDW